MHTLQEVLLRIANKEQSSNRIGNNMADLYEDARRYDALAGQHFGSHDAAYWQAQAAQYADPVLELACGSGRLTLPIAAQGMEIAGLDSSEPMLTLAREKSAHANLPIDWYLGDMADFNLNRRFSLIFVPNNSIAHLLAWHDFGCCLACVRRHLTADGRFMLDYFNPSLMLLSRSPDTRYPAGSFDAPDGSGQIRVSEQVRYDAATQINHIRWFWHSEATGKEQVSDFSMRVYFPQELDALLAHSGFAIEEKYGDFDFSPFMPASRRQLVVAKVM